MPCEGLKVNKVRESNVLPPSKKLDILEFKKMCQET